MGQDLPRSGVSWGHHQASAPQHVPQWEPHLPLKPPNQTVHSRLASQRPIFLNGTPGVLLCSSISFFLLHVFLLSAFCLILWLEKFICVKSAQHDWVNQDFFFSFFFFFGKLLTPLTVIFLNLCIGSHTFPFFVRNTAGA